MTDVDGHQIMIIAARAVDPLQYSPRLFKIWEDTCDELRRRGDPVPSIYPGSITDECPHCGIAIAIGPRQAAARKLWNATGQCYELACLACMKDLIEVEYKRVVDVRVTSLNNGDPPA